MGLIIDLKGKVVSLTPEIYYLIKIISICQLILIVTLLVILFTARILLKLNNYRYLVKKNRIIDLLDKEINLAKFTIKNFRKNIWIVIEYLRSVDNDKVKKLLLNQDISEKVIKYQARSLIKSQSWLKKYIATQCYYYGLDKEDESLLINLINHSKKLVCLGAAMVIFKYPSSNSVNNFIDAVSKSRRLNQVFFIEVLADLTEQEKKNLVPFFLNRLKKEEDPYARAFCYRVASHLTAKPEFLYFIRQDVLSSCIELQLAAIYYLAIIPSPTSIEMLINFLEDSKFEVRAVAAKLLGEVGAERSIDYLDEKLKDSAWWVRINAAEALSKLGDKGVAVLRKQSPDVDRFAYEVANKVLINKDLFC